MPPFADEVAEQAQKTIQEANEKAQKSVLDAREEAKKIIEEIELKLNNMEKIDLTNMSSQYYHTNECANNFLNSEIKITDNVGNIYSFGGLSKYLEYTIPMQSPKSGGGIPTITSWFLKKIEYYEFR